MRAFRKHHVTAMLCRLLGTERQRQARQTREDNERRVIPDNPDAMRKQWDRRRSRVRAQMLGNPDLACAYCAEPLNAVTLTVDHVVPISEGGTNEPDNLAPCCYACNQQRNDATIVAAYGYGEPPDTMIRSNW